MDIKDININSIKVADIHPWDYPDFCDAFIDSAEFKNGDSLTPKDLEEFEILDGYDELLREAIEKEIY